MNENKYMNLSETGYLVHRTSVEKGFYNEKIDVNFVLSKIALLHSECSELLEAVRKDKGQTEIMDEVADTFIRLVDLVEALKEGGFVDQNVLLHDAIENKMRVNTERPQKHGNLA